MEGTGPGLGYNVVCKILSTKWADATGIMEKREGVRGPHVHRQGIVLFVVAG